MRSQFHIYMGQIFKNGPSKICGRQLLVSPGELQNNASQS